jgi:alpha-galactosidase
MQALVKKWLDRYISENNAPPFSFFFGHHQFLKTLSRWKRDQSETSIRYIDPRTGIEIRWEWKLYSNWPAIEWMVHFHNTSSQKTPLLSQIQALDCKELHPILPQSPQYCVHYLRGSDAKNDDFAPISKSITSLSPLKLKSVGGRSSNITAIPIFNLELQPGYGTIIALGWSGQWALQMDILEGKLHIQAGMEKTRIQLEPNEEIRSPRILLFFYENLDFYSSQNAWRRFLLEHIVPKDPTTKKAWLCPLSCSSFRLYHEANETTIQNQMDFARIYHPFGIEALWIDAGWFEGKWPNGVGNWFPRADGYPNGFKPLTDYLKTIGMKLILWFEPERVYRGTQLDRLHHDWILEQNKKPNRLLNLGHPLALNWLINLVREMIQREGIGIYRQDFNINPLEFWKKVDSRNRQGITEIRYITALYTFWDTIRTEFPDVMIDNCASGGRRIDLETISRSVMLWRTDYQYFEPNGYLNHTMGINFFIPTTSTGTDHIDKFSFRSSINSGISVAWNPYAPDFPRAWIADRLAEFKRIRLFFHEDFYPLTPYSTNLDKWIAYQFHNPKKNSGIVIVFRKEKAEEKTQTIAFHGLLASESYEVKWNDERRIHTISGGDLLHGLSITLLTAPSSELIEYQLVVK